jgi:hypothetical protein
MFEARVTRTSEGQTILNTLAMPTVRIRFQICPGTGAGLGIAGVPYQVLLNGTKLKDDTTDANGEATVEILVIQQGGAVLHIFDTDYNLSFSLLQALTTTPGQQKRLEVMGYFSGYQLVALLNNAIDDGIDTPGFQQAIMNFQTDQVIAMDGIIGPTTRGKMQTAAGE